MWHIYHVVFRTVQLFPIHILKSVFVDVFITPQGIIWLRNLNILYIFKFHHWTKLTKSGEDSPPVHPPPPPQRGGGGGDAPFGNCTKKRRVGTTITHLYTPYCTEVTSLCSPLAIEGRVIQRWKMYYNKNYIKRHFFIKKRERINHTQLEILGDTIFFYKMDNAECRNTNRVVNVNLLHYHKLCETYLGVCICTIIRITRS